MKKYFTKFIPVEGEIKKGDIVMCTNGVCVIWGDKSIFGLQFVDEDVVNHLKDPRVAQLMLCTCDVKVGDKINGDNHTNTLFNKPKLMVADGETGPIEGNWFNESMYAKPFKIIAPISKGAKWLKKDQELNESQILNIYSVDVKISNPARLQIETARFQYFPTDDDVETWADNYLNNHGGRGASWEIKDAKLDHIKVLCDNCETFH